MMSVVESAISPLSSIPSSPPYHSSVPHDHFVQFYSHDHCLIQAVKDYLLAAFKCINTGIVIIATQQHTAAIVEMLNSLGLNVDHFIQTQQLTILDAHEVMAKFINNKEIDHSKFYETIGGLLKHIKLRFTNIAAYGN
jgi:hypothetical protein